MGAIILFWVLIGLAALPAFYLFIRVTTWLVLSSARRYWEWERRSGRGLDEPFNRKDFFL